MKFDVACAAWQRKHWRACAPASGRSTAGLGGSLVAALIAAGLLGGCASSNDPPASSDARLSRPTRKFTSADYGARVVEPGQPVPKGGGVYKLGAPYRMGGKWYVPREEPGYDAAGTASWYGEDFHGRRTANGEIYDMHALTAAHPTLPLPSYAWVTNQSNGRTVLVRINDRGPYARDRVIDLSRTAARELGYEGNGTAQVRVRYAGPAPLDGNDARERQVLAHAPWRRGPQLAARDEVRPAQPAWKAPRQDLARPVPAVPARAAEPRYAAPAQSRYAASAPSPPTPRPRPATPTARSAAISAVATTTRRSRHKAACRRSRRWHRRPRPWPRRLPWRRCVSPSRNGRPRTTAAQPIRPAGRCRATGRASPASGARSAAPDDPCDRNRGLVLRSPRVASTVISRAGRRRPRPLTAADGAPIVVPGMEAPFGSRTKRPPNTEPETRMMPNSGTRQVRVARPLRTPLLSAFVLLSFALALALGCAPLAAEQPGEFSGRAPRAVLMDADTGAILYQRSADEAAPPASLSKLMTLAVLFRTLKSGQLKHSDEFLISVNAWRKGGAPSGTSAMMIPVNTRARLDELIQGIIVQSGNDACIAVAEGIAGSEANFAKMMDEEGRRIGLKNSSFRNPTGLYQPEHLMSARDLAVLARTIIKEYPEFYRVFGQKEFTYRRHKFINRNPLLFLNVGADGMKTGFVKEAGYGLVGSAVQDGRRLILVIMGLHTAEERKTEAQRLIEWGFKNLTQSKLFDAGEVIGSARVWGGDRMYVPLVANGELSIVLPKLPANPRLKAEIIYKYPLKAPIEKGEVVASLRVTSASNAQNEVPLMAAEPVARAGVMRRGLDTLLHLALRWAKL